MITIDNLKDCVPVKGYFKVEMFDKEGKCIEEFEQHNIVVNQARLHFMKLISGQYNTTKQINKLILGNEGIQNEDDSLPKDETTGVSASLTDLFCGAQNDISRGGTNHKTKYDYITFTPAVASISGSVGSSNATNVKDNGSNRSTVTLTVNVSAAAPQVTYTFNIDTSAFNGKTDYMKYNEAGLFADDTLIALRTFKSKSKDSSTTMRITWTLTF